MAAPAAPSGGVLPKDPKKRRMLLALAGAAALALIVLLQRRGAPAEEPAEQFSYGPDPAAVPPGSSFADNGEAAGQLSTAITGGLGDVAYGLEAVTSSQEQLAGTFAGQFEGFGERLGSLEETLRSINEPGAAVTGASTDVATTGSPGAAQVVRRDRYGRTYQERRAIQTERQAGTGVDRFGRTPTERRLARTNPKVKQLLRTRLTKQRAQDRRPSQPPRRQARPPARRRRR